ncbi:MAG: phosphoglucosamine mutase [Bacteroidales bacterium]|nr:phosphoglucosamine mutase [Bacteroidales bacterium]
MALIKSISGIRGTIGGPAGNGLTPIDIVKFTYAYCRTLPERKARPADGSGKYRIVVGKDGRISGSMVEQLVCGTLVACGVNVVKCGYASTPTTELAVNFANADGGIIITASHNPRHWNALKLLNDKGEFLTAEQGRSILELAQNEDFDFTDVDGLGTVEERDFTDAHIDSVLALEEVDAQAVRKAGFKIVVDCINSVGSIIMPRLLERLGAECIVLNGDITGDFAHNPEPLPRNLTALSEAVVRHKADLGISVDPDVDRLAFICENGEPFVEENTLIAVADYLLGRAEARGIKDLRTVSNLSSSRGLRDVTEAHGGVYCSAAVGEVNVTTRMHEVGALIGGEGNGGVIYPASHYGRDAMTGTALFLSLMARNGMKVSEYKKTLPEYYIDKNRIELTDMSLAEPILTLVREHYANENVNTLDGVRIDFEKERKWTILRRSNTEPIIRVYSEAPTEAEAKALSAEIMDLASRMTEK